MPLSKISANGITTINSTQIAGGLGSIALDIASGTGNGALSVPIGTTAQRPSTPIVGYMRFNTDLGVLENYTANGWFKVSIQQPTITSVSGNIYNGNTSVLLISGQGFGVSGANVTFTGANTVSVTGLIPSNGGTLLSVPTPARRECAAKFRRRARRPA